VYKQVTLTTGQVAPCTHARVMGARVIPSLPSYCRLSQNSIRSQSQKPIEEYWWRKNIFKNIQTDIKSTQHNTTQHNINVTMWQALCICIVYMRGKCISYAREASVDYMYERQVYIICMRGKCISYVWEASVDYMYERQVWIICTRGKCVSFRFGRTRPKKKKEKKKGI